MTARVRFASSLFAVPTLCVFLLCATLPAAAKDDWQSDLHKWIQSSQTDPNCKVRYTIGIYRPDMGDKPTWDFMTEKMFKWFSRDGAKLVPSVCPVSHATRDKAEYRILFSVSPMKTISQTTHGSEVHTTSEPFNASITSRTTYSDGGFAHGTATINGQQTSTVVVPTETTISRSSVAQYMYTYRINGDQLELIASDSVVFSRVAVSGSGEDAAAAEMGGVLRNIVNMSGDRHREDKLFEKALKAIRADAQDNAVKQNALLETRASANPPTLVPAPIIQSSTPPAQTSLNIESSPSGADITIDGAFVGNTPSTVTAGPGSHQITVKKKGFTDWTRTLNVSGGMVHIDAELEPVPPVSPSSKPTTEQTSTNIESNPSAQSIDTLKEQAASGAASAQFTLGEDYRFGSGVPQDYTQSSFWYRKAADQGDAKAQMEIGLAYSMGNGVPHDDIQAAGWYRKAAEQGQTMPAETMAQSLLAIEYFSGGSGVPQDYVEAYFWFSVYCAAEVPWPMPFSQEDAKMRDVAAMHLSRSELFRVQERARKWFEDHHAKPQ